MTLKIGALTKLGLFLPVVCFIHVFDHTLAEQLYCDKCLLVELSSGLYNICINSKICLPYATSVILTHDAEATF